MSQNIIVTGTNSGFGRLIVQTLAGNWRRAAWSSDISVGSSASFEA